ncbi:MAG: YlbF family regulator [Oscillospiraceae bacterium]|nr:YlbF family regulator [Oscillospiraceae bacterium]
MDVITAARELGKAIQADERYKEYANAKKANDEDIGLQGLIGKLNILQMSYQNESEKENPDEKKLEQWDADFRNTYAEVMLNAKMRDFEEKKQIVDDLMNYIVNLLSLCVNGADPETAEPVQSDGSGCTGSCSTCGGCG